MVAVALVLFLLFVLCSQCYCVAVGVCPVGGWSVRVRRRTALRPTRGCSGSNIGCVGHGSNITASSDTGCFIGVGRVMLLMSSAVVFLMAVERREREWR